MPGSTPIYGFPYPEPTDLVADYPALGQDLAEDIEAVLPTLGGLTLLSPTSITFTGTSASSTAGTTTFSAVTVLTVNGLFSASYQTYMLVMAYTSTTAGNLTLRMTTGGTPHTGATSYTRQRLIADSTTVTAQRGSDAYWYVSPNNSTTKNLTVVYLADPFAASRTILIANALESSSGGVIFNSAGNHDQTVSYDGLQFNQLSTGNVTGTIRCYGLKGA